MPTPDIQEQLAPQKPLREQILDRLGAVAGEIEVVTNEFDSAHTASLEAEARHAKLASERLDLLNVALDDVQARIDSGELDDRSVFDALAEIGQKAAGHDFLSKPIADAHELRSKLGIGQPVMTGDKDKIKKIVEPPEGEANFVPAIDRDRETLGLGFWTWLEEPDSDEPKKIKLDRSSSVGAREIEEALDREVRDNGSRWYRLTEFDQFKSAARTSDCYRTVGQEYKATVQKVAAVKHAVATITEEISSLIGETHGAMAWLLEHSAADMQELYDESAIRLVASGIDGTAYKDPITFANAYARATNPSWRSLSKSEQNHLVLTTLDEMNQRGSDLQAAEKAAAEARVAQGNY